MSGGGTGRAGRVVAGALGVVLLAAGLAALSAVPYTAERQDAGRIRVSWRFTPARPTAACGPADTVGLGRVPVHMRNPDACVVPNPAFRLRVEVDGRVLTDERIRPGGARADRPVYVFRELTVEPGCRDVALRFASEASLEGDRLPDVLELSTRVDLGSREVAVITLDRRTGEPTLLGRSCDAPDPPTGG